MVYPAIVDYEGESLTATLSPLKGTAHPPLSSTNPLVTTPYVVPPVLSTHSTAAAATGAPANCPNINTTSPVPRSNVKSWMTPASISAKSPRGPMKMRRRTASLGVTEKEEVEEELSSPPYARRPSEESSTT